MRKVVGIDRKIKRAWLDATLDRLAQTGEETDLRSFLDKHLKDELPGKESRAKTSGVILRIWSSIPPERASLRNRAVALLPRISGQERIWLHWGMAALAYPFFRDIAEVVGRLLALQDDFTTAQVQARMLTSWGDRATSKEAAQKLVTMLVDWEVLRSTKTRGHFLLARKMVASTPELQLWLLEALLSASAAEEIEAQQLLRLPESFPFAIAVGLADLRRYDGFNIHRQGLDMDMIALSKLKSASLRQAAGRIKASGRSTRAALPSPGLFSDAAATSLDNTPAKDHIGSQKGQQSIGEALTPDDHPFAAASAECLEQFRKGHYFASIALAQALIDASIDFIWRTTNAKQRHHQETFKAKLDVLRKRKLLNLKLIEKLMPLSTARHSLYHAQSNTVQDHVAIQTAAAANVKLLCDVELALFVAASGLRTIVPSGDWKTGGTGTAPRKPSSARHVLTRTEG